MAITYAVTPFVRPAADLSGSGGPKLPLILRNPQNDNTQHDYEKDGPSPALKFGPSDYRMWFEGLNSTQYAGLTNFFYYGTSTDGHLWTKTYDSTLQPVLGNWEKGEICPSTWWWDQYARHFKMIYHGGNNAGPRQIGLMTSPTGLPGTWVRANGGLPVMANGGSGAWDESYVADAHVIQLGANDYRMLYKGARVSDGKSQIGYATSTNCLTWTKSGSNPVLPLGTGNEVNDVIGPWAYVDELNRVHMWYPGWDSTNVQRILYAYSDDWVTWTRNQADVILAGSATASDPDTSVGDVVKGWVDDGLLFFTTMAFNFSGYTGDAIGRLEGRSIYWLPKKAAVQPTRPARAVVPIAGASRWYLSAPVAAAMLTSATAFSIWMDFRCPPGSTYRFLYLEHTDFNHQIKIGIDTAGKFDAWYRAGTLCPLVSAARYDDNKWHRVLMRRTANAAFSLYVDGVSVATSAVAGSVATAPATIDLLGVDPADTVSAPLAELHGAAGMSRRLVTIAGYAMSDAEEVALWNNGSDGGAVPSGGTLKLNLKFGSGGAAGPDVDLSGNAYSVSVTGAVMVDGQPITQQNWRASSNSRRRRIGLL